MPAAGPGRTGRLPGPAACRVSGIPAAVAGGPVSGIANAVAVAGMPLLAVEALHASIFVVAALTAAAYLPSLVIGLPAGAWAGTGTCPAAGRDTRRVVVEALIEVEHDRGLCPVMRLACPLSSIFLVRALMSISFTPFG